MNEVPIRTIEDETLVIRVKPNDIKLQVARSAVSNLVSSASAGEVKK